MPKYEESRSFSAPLESVREAASDALGSIGAKPSASSDGLTLKGTTGWTIFSFGEHVEVALAPSEGSVQVTVRSSQAFPLAAADLGGRNKKNVGGVINAMATRLRS